MQKKHQTTHNTQKSLMRAFARKYGRDFVDERIRRAKSAKIQKRQIILRLLRNGAKRMQQQEKLRKRNSAIFRTGIMMYLI